MSAQQSAVTPTRRTTASPTEVRDRASVRVFVLDDHPVVRDGVMALLDAVPDFEVVGGHDRAGGAVERVLAAAPDVAVLDARLPDGSGIDICRAIRSANPRIHCLILTSYDDHDAALTAVMAGASGYILKSVPLRGLADAVRQAAQGVALIDPAIISETIDRVKHGTSSQRAVRQLSPRERAMLDLVAEGLTNRQIGERVGLSERTVKNYVSIILRKLSLERRTQAAVLVTQARHRVDLATEPPAPL